METDAGWVRIERVFDASIEAVWAMWTEADKFRQWYGPNGATIPVAEMDLQVGGTRKICMEMQMPDRSMQMWFTGVYKDITPPHRLVYTESMCDAEGTLIPLSAMGMPEGTPQITEVHVTLSAENGQTRMVMIHRGVKAGTAGEGGWMQAIEKLTGIVSA